MAALLLRAQQSSSPFLSPASARVNIRHSSIYRLSICFPTGNHVGQLQTLIRKPNLRRSFCRSSPRHAEILVTVPQMAESIQEGTIAALLRKVGDRVTADEELATIETDKIDVSVSAPASGSITEVFVQEGDVVIVGQEVARLETSDTEASGQEKTLPAVPESSRKDETPVLPESQRQARITQAEPVIAPSPTKPVSIDTTVHHSKESITGTLASPGPFPPGHPPRTERFEKMTRMRKAIAARLKQSQNNCAFLTVMQELDMSALIAWRAKYKESVAEKHGVRLGYMGAFIKATSLAAQQIPVVNGKIDIEQECITFRDYVDISVAVSTPKGLVTPVIRNCESLGVIDIEREVAALALKARNSKLTMDDLDGGNFSISNPGIFGSMFGTPLINYPQAAVFNMNSIKDSVVAIDGRLEIRPMMYITLTYDHRLIDGREAVRFLNIVKEYIEDPSSILLA